MAITVTNLGQNASKGTVTNQSVTIPAGGVPAGSLIIVCFEVGAASGAPNFTVSDSASNTYQQPASLQTSFNGLTSNAVGIAYAFNCAALVQNNTITVTNNSGVLTDMSTSFFFATGVQTASDPLDAHGTATGTSGTPSVSTTAATSQAGELIAAVLMVAGPSGDTFTQDATNEGGFTTPPVRVGTTGGGASSNRTIAGGNVPGWTGSGTATYAPTITSRSWSSVIATFKPQPPPKGWIVDPDQPVYSKPTFTVPSAFAPKPPAAAVAISGMAWFEPPDRDKPQQRITIEAPEAINYQFVPAVGVSGIPWSQPKDQPFYSKPAQTDPAAMDPQFVPAVGISGIPWSEQPDQPFYSAKGRTDPPAAFGQFVPAVGISGIPWSQPKDQPLYTKPGQTDPAAMDPQFVVAVGISGIAFFEPPDQPFYSVKGRTDPLAFTEQVPPVVSTISGMAWFEPPEKAIYGQVNYTIPPAWTGQFEPAVGISGIPWSEQPDQPFYSVKGRTDPPAAFGQFEPAVGISGMAWFTPPEKPFYGAVSFTVAPAWTWQFIPAVGISGIAWQEPLDQPFYRAPSFSVPAAWDPQFVPAVGVGGMAWFEPADDLSRPSPKPPTVTQAFVAQPPVAVPISGMAWFEPLDQPVYSIPFNSVISFAFGQPPFPIPPPVVTVSVSSGAATPGGGHQEKRKGGFDPEAEQFFDDMYERFKARQVHAAAVNLGQLGGLKGGKARANKMTSKQRSEAARRAALARWRKK